MSEHLPECLVPMDLDRGFWLCICRELRSCTERVIAAGDEQSRIAYTTGYRHALDAAVQRLEDYLQHDVADGWMPRQKAEGIIATITTGDY